MLQDTLASVASVLPQISNLFEIDIGDTDIINQILDRARESLDRISRAGTENAQLDRWTDDPSE